MASVQDQHGFSTFLSVSKHNQRFYHFFACTKVYVEIAYIFKLFPFRGPDSARFKVFYILVASISSQFYLGQAKPFSCCNLLYWLSYAVGRLKDKSYLNFRSDPSSPPLLIRVFVTRVHRKYAGELLEKNAREYFFCP